MRQFDRDEIVVFRPYGTSAVYEARVLHLRGDGNVAIAIRDPSGETLREVAQTAELERCQMTRETL
jgi:hypothetical protein